MIEQLKKEQETLTQMYSKNDQIIKLAETLLQKEQELEGLKAENLQLKASIEQGAKPVSATEVE